MSQLHFGKLPALPHLNGVGGIFSGTAGDDAQDGTAGNDTFNFDQGGNDTLNGLDGNDTFNMGAAFNADDAIDGGNGKDMIVLNGDYNFALGNSTMFGVETMQLTGGHDYAFTLAQVSLLTVSTFTFDASALGAGDTSVLDTGTSDGGRVLYKGGGGADSFRFGPDVSGIFDGAGGDDTVEFRAGATSQMLVNGGSGDDTVQFDINGTNGASPHIALGASAIKNVETLRIETNLAAISLRMNDGNVAAGKTLVVTTYVNDGATAFHFDGSRESDGHFDVSGGGLDDVLGGGKLSDTFHLDASLAAGGADAVYGEDGDDTITMGDTLENGDTIDGGAGNDTLYLSGDYTSGVNFVPDVIHGIEEIVLGAGFDYYLPLHGAAIDRNKTLTVDASALGASDVADVRTEHAKGHLDATGGDGDDTLIGGDVSDHLVGGAGGDTLVGRLGGDTMQGGAGNDYYFLFQPDNSTGPNYDTFVGFDADVDFIVTRNPVDAIDAAVNTGTLSSASFNADLKAALGAGQLGIHHAVLFLPDAGGLAGHTFLVIDDNGVAGYQSNADFVIDITGASHLGHLGTEDFGPLIG